MGEEPLEALEGTVGETVTVRLKDDTTVNGTLTGFDQHMNLVLRSPAVEPAEGADAVDNTTVIRGDNVVSVQT